MITYRLLTPDDDRDKMMMMMMWYRQLVDQEQNPLHQTQWPLGVIENPEMQVEYLGAFDGEQLVGMIGYTPIYFDSKNESQKPLAIFEIMLFVSQEYSGQGIGSHLWKELADFAKGQGLPLWVGNNTEGGNASLRNAVGPENVQIHMLTAVSNRGE